MFPTLPPYSQEAEEALIGSVLINPAAFPELAKRIKPDDFLLIRNARIWQSFERLNARGDEIDYLTVTEDLKTHRQTEEIGGEVYIIGLARSVPTSTFAKAYADIVERASIRRRLIAAADEIKALAYNESLNLEDVLFHADEKLYTVRSRMKDGLTWQIVDVQGLYAQPQMRWLIRDRLPAEGLAMIFGQSGSFKSFLALALAIHVAQRESVLYIAAEGKYGMPARVQAYEQHFGVKLANLFFCLGAVDMFNNSELTLFKREAARVHPALIVVDTFAMCVGMADENSTSDMKRIVENCQRISQEFQCAVLIVHHTNKEGKLERGNQSLRNACDVVIRLSKQDDTLKVESQKMRDKTKFPTYYMKALPVELGYADLDGEPVSSVVLLPAESVQQTTTDNLTEMQRDVLEAIADEPYASSADIAAITDIARGTVNNILRRLTQLGNLKAWNGKTRELTEQGRKTLGHSDSSDSSEIQLNVTDSSENGVESVESVESVKSKVTQGNLFAVPDTYYSKGG